MSRRLATSQLWPPEEVFPAVVSRPLQIVLTERRPDARRIPRSHRGTPIVTAAAAAPPVTSTLKTSLAAQTRVGRRPQRSKLSAPTVIGAAAPATPPFGPLNVHLTPSSRTGRRPILSRVSPPELVAAATVFRRAQVNLTDPVKGRARRVPHSRLAPPTVIDPAAPPPSGSVFATLAVHLSPRRQARLPHSRLAPPFRSTDLFKTTRTWTAPPGVTSVTVWAWGGGGGGGGGGAFGANASGGGGGGAFALGAIQVTPGNTYTITVGTGGATFNSGGDSSVTGDAGTTVVAKGGDGGNNSHVHAAGGQASASTGTLKFSGGQSGQAGDNVGNGGGGGGGAAGTTADGSAGSDPSDPLGGSGGSGGTVGGGAGGHGGDVNVSNQRPGVFPGGGGGGKGSGFVGDGAAGADGQVLLIWPGPSFVTLAAPVTAHLAGKALGRDLVTRRGPHSKLRTPTVVAAPLVFAPVAVHGTDPQQPAQRGHRRKPHSRLQPPTVVGTLTLSAARTAAHTADRQAAQRKTSRLPRSKLRGPIVVSASPQVPTQFAPYRLVRAGGQQPQQRDTLRKPHSKLRAPTVVATGTVFRPVRLQLTTPRLTMPKRRTRALEHVTITPPPYIPPPVQQVRVSQEAVEVERNTTTAARVSQSATETARNKTSPNMYLSHAPTEIVRSEDVDPAVVSQLAVEVLCVGTRAGHNRFWATIV